MTSCCIIFIYSKIFYDLWLYVSVRTTTTSLTENGQVCSVKNAFSEKFCGK